MDCVACGHDNREAAAFCEECGTRVVSACTSCAAELRPNAKFCDQCGTRTGVAAPMDAAPSTATGDRKVVTILFADLSGSTSLQERLDAEATARLMARIQTVLSAAVTEHDGRVVKSTGDGLMAVFGAPRVREDDAVRAVRAGVAMQAAFASLDLADVGLRVGVNTGEVVVAPDSDDVVGDPVNVAARLEGAARLGDVLVGPETQRLVRDVIGLEPVEPLVLKGKARPVPAARVVHEVIADATAPTPFLGRDRDVAALISTLDDAVATTSTRLVTVLGWPGLGKSRLATELVTIIGERATVLEARFVAAGGTSFGPIAAALGQVVDPASLDLGADTERVAATVGALVSGGSPGSTEQVFWSIRRVLEGLAARRPVVVVLDDLHWAEPAMLDLVEHLAEWLLGVPVLLLALARPELRDLRPSLLDATGPSSSVIVLGGLDADACRRLALDVLEADTLPDGIVRRALEASEGNPLFLRELLRLLVDDGVLRRDEGGGWALTVEIDAIELPATIHAALAARIEQLQPDERAVLQAASVIGRHFARGAVASLLPSTIAARLDAHLSALHRRALVDPEGTWWDDERMFRFHHVLIRDAAYRRVLKEVRADQHVQYADWLAARADGEHDEVLGFHLEQALAYRRELGEPIDVGTVDRAVHHLAVAGRRALDGDDLANAAALLGRALALAPGDPDLLRDRCEALVAGGDVHAAVHAVAELAAAADDERTRALADVFDAQLTAQRSPDALRSVAARAASAASILSANDDDVGVAHAESVHATALAGLGQIAACEAALDRSLAAARRAGDTRRANAVLSIAPAAALWGPSPIARASGRCLDVVRVLRITSWAPHVEAHALRHQAVLEAMRDRADAARRMLTSAKQTFTDLGHRLGLLEVAMYEGLVELLDGDAAAAELPLRCAVEGFDALGARVSVARATALLARAVLDLDRLDEACELADPLLAGDDLKASIGLLGVAAEVRARRGESSEAEALARRAVALAEPTDALTDHADARLSLARVLTAAGKHDEAGRERDRARELYEAKGATVGMRRAECGADTSSASAAEASPTIREGRPRRRVAVNAAVESAERWYAAMQRRDFPAARATLSPDRVTVNHRVDPREEHGGATTTVGDFEAPGVTVHQEVLATLGERHVLVRRVWQYPEDGDRGAVEVDNVTVLRVDRTGLVVRSDAFIGGRDLAPALRCLTERWAEDELDGDELALARQMANGWDLGSAYSNRDWDRVAELYTTDVVMVDHRVGAAGEHAGRDAVVEYYRGLREVVDAAQITTTDVHALDISRSLLDVVVRGQRAGESFEFAGIAAVEVGPDGRMCRFEVFEPGSLADAWACFDGFGGTVVAHRHLRPNLATEVARQRSDLMRSGQMQAARALFSPELVVMDHRMQSEFPRRDHVEGITSRVPRVDRVEPVAALGDRHAVTRSHQAWDDDDGGTIEWSLLNVIRADERGRYARIDTFESDSLAEALECVVTRWAEDELKGDERERALHVAGCFRMFAAIRHADWQGFGSVFEDDAELHDLREAATGQVQRGRAEITAWLRSFAEVAEQSTSELVDVLDLTPEVSLWAVRNEGTTVGGGEFERSSLLAVRFGRTGRIGAARLFDPEATERARSWLDATRGAARRVAPNQATAAVERRMRARLARDVDAFAELLAEDYVRVAHSLQTTFSRPEELHLAADTWEGTGSLQWEVIASLGVGRCLISMELGWVEVAHGGEAELHRLQVCSTDASGRLTKVESFDGDELPAALSCLVGGWAEHELEGFARIRQLRRAATFRMLEMASRGEWDAFASLLAENAEMTDHRPRGVGSPRGKDAILRWIGVIDAGRDTAIVVTDVLGLNADVSLIETVGTGDVSGVGFEMPSLLVTRCDADGSVDRFEVFGADQVSDAWSCFDRLTAEARLPGRRRFHRNRAVDTVERLVVGVSSGDKQLLADLFAASFVRTDHVLRADEDRDTQLWSVMTLVDFGARLEAETLATLGDRHGVARLRMVWPSLESSGETELVRLYVGSVDADGRFFRFDHFPEDDVAAALTCLVERWARDEVPAGAQRDAMLAWSASLGLFAVAGRGDWQQHRSHLHDDVVVVDRRIVGAGEVRGADAVQAWLGSSVESGCTAFAVTDVIALVPGRSLLHVVRTDDEDGERSEVTGITMIEAAPDGRVLRFELFDPQQVDAAWQAFDRSVGDERRVAPNLAITAYARWAAAARSGDPSAQSAIDAPGYRRIDHELRAEIPGRRADLVEQGYRIVDATFEPLASLGQRHALCRMAVEWRDDAGEQVRFDRLAVTRTDATGLVLQDDLFAPESLSAALAVLYERWGDEEGVGERPAGIARSWSYTDAVAEADWDRYGSLFAADAVQVDHRPTGAGAIRGRSAIVDWIRELAAIVDGVRPRVVDVLAATPDAALWQNVATGRADGGVYEIHSYVAARWDGDGRFTRLEMFPLDRRGDAWTCFQRLDETIGLACESSADRVVQPATDGAPTVPELSETRAIRALRSWCAAVERSDAVRVTGLLAPDVRCADRRSITGGVFTGREAVAALAMSIAESRGLGAISFAPLATRGEDVALCSVLVPFGEQRSVEVDLVSVVTTGDDGLLHSIVLFDASAVDDGYEELDRAAISAAPQELRSTVTAAIEITRAYNSRDIARMRRALAPDAVVIDHRPAGWGQLDVDAYLRGVETFLGQSGDARLRDVEWFHLAPGCVGSRVVVVGSDVTGGRLEIPVLTICSLGGDQLRTLELFPVDRLSDARATASKRRVVPDNAALRLQRQWLQCANAGDVEGAARIIIDDHRFHDRRSLVGGDLQRGAAASRDLLAAVLDQGMTRIVSEPLDARGERHALTRITFTSENGDEVEMLNVVEAAASLDRVAAGWVFDPDAIETARAFLYERSRLAPVARRVTPNRASELVAAWASAFNRRDLDAANVLRSAAYERPDHQWHHVVDRVTAVALDEVTSVDGRADIELLATLGARHSLCHLRFSVGDTVTERYLTTNATEDLRLIERDELFGPDQLLDALARLAECAGEAGLESVCRSVDAVTEGNWVAFRARLDPNVVLVDHRVASAREVTGQDDVLEYLRAQRDAAEGVTIRIDDVLAVTRRGAVTCSRVGERAGDAELMWPSIVVATSTAGSLIGHIDLFAPEAGEDAVARFHELTAPPARRVAANLATESLERWTAAARAQDRAGTAALYAPDHRLTRHDHQLSVDGDTYARREQELVERGSIRVEVLASLGRRHALHRDDVEWDEDGEGQLVAMSVLGVSGVDDLGRFVHDEVFRPEHLHRALARLVERWADAECDGAERDRAQQVARSLRFPDLVTARDWEGYRRLLSSDTVQVDHRPTGAGEVHGPDAVVAWIRELDAVAGRVTVTYEDVLALTPTAILWRNLAAAETTSGTVHRPSLVAAHWDQAGRTDRSELFPVEEVDAAWRCFDRLVAWSADDDARI